MTTEFYRDPQTVLYLGDVRDVLSTLPSESIQMAVTSPPYWGLRDYGTAAWDGGDAQCDHRPPVKPRSERPRNGLEGGLATIDAAEPFYRDICGKCGAKRLDLQLGIEPTPEEYVAAMVDVFREVRRVLKRDGTLWLNIGDSYASSIISVRHGQKLSSGIKPKDLLGIPWMLAFALRADGWYLRQDIIWAKPDPMPESIKDRCTKSHEYLFLLSKSSRYYFNSEAIAEPSIYAGEVKHYREDAKAYTALKDDHMRTRPSGTIVVKETRNKRDVWIVPTPHSPDLHFATFPEQLVQPCILAGSREGDTILDPFIGSGTTAIAARKLNRNAIGIDLSKDYLAIAQKRITAVTLPMPLYAHS
jgi:DNA modification methylase